MPVKGSHHTEESKRKISKSAKGKIPWNKGKKGLQVGWNKEKHLTEEHKKKISDSHKGKHFTEEHKKNLSESLKGRHLTEEHRKNISKATSGEKNPNYGKHLSKEHIEKIRLSNIGNDYWKGRHHTKETRKKLSELHSGKKHFLYGKHRLEEVKQKISEATKGRIVTEKTRKKMSEAQSGEKSHLYGKHPSKEIRDKIRNTLIDWDFYNEHGCLKCNYPYNDCFTEKFKDKIRALYDNKCVVTGMTNEEHKAKYGMSLHVHHWMYNKDETNPFYFVPVTNEINAMANFNRHEWAELFNGIAEDKYCEMMR